MSYDQYILRTALRERKTNESVWVRAALHVPVLHEVIGVNDRPLRRFEKDRMRVNIGRLTKFEIDDASQFAMPESLDPIEPVV